MPAILKVDPNTISPDPADVSPEVLAGFLIDGDEELARWASGRWTVSEEHLATRTLASVMVAFAPPDMVDDRVAPVAALAGVAGEEHATRLLALDHVLREVGWATVDPGSALDRTFPDRSARGARQMVRSSTQGCPIAPATSDPYRSRCRRPPRWVRLRGVDHRPRDGNAALVRFNVAMHSLAR